MYYSVILAMNTQIHSALCSRVCFTASFMKGVFPQILFAEHTADLTLSQGVL
jgi:hypothetical protein